MSIFAMDDDSDMESTIDLLKEEIERLEAKLSRSKQEAYREVFWDFVLPMCNELLKMVAEYRPGEPDIAVFQYLDATRHQIVYGNADNIRIDHYGTAWSNMKHRIGYFLKPDEYDRETGVKKKTKESGDGKKEYQ